MLSWYAYPMFTQKKFFAVSVLILVLLFAFGLGRAWPVPEREESVPIIFEEIINSEEPEEVVRLSPPETRLVIRVIDGDTIELQGGTRVRYIGIDTPESVDPRKPVECFGVEAKKKNEELVLGKRVRLEKDVSETDRYGRLVRYAYADGIFVNLELVKAGFAHSYTYPPDVKYQDQFVAAQKEAREAGRGLWTACASPSLPSAVPTETSLSGAAEGGAGDCAIKGNSNSAGEKIYHLPGCGTYNQTHIDEPRGERWFCTEDEAAAAGWRKAKNCP